VRRLRVVRRPYRALILRLSSRRRRSARADVPKLAQQRVVAQHGGVERHPDRLRVPVVVAHAVVRHRAGRPRAAGVPYSGREHPRKRGEARFRLPKSSHSEHRGFGRNRGGRVVGGRDGEARGRGRGRGSRNAPRRSSARVGDADADADGRAQDRRHGCFGIGARCSLFVTGLDFGADAYGTLPRD